MYPFKIDSLSSFTHVFNTNIFKYIYIYIYRKKERYLKKK